MLKFLISFQIHGFITGHATSLAECSLAALGCLCALTHSRFRYPTCPAHGRSGHPRGRPPRDLCSFRRARRAKRQQDFDLCRAGPSSHWTPNPLPNHPPPRAEPSTRPRAVARQTRGPKTSPHRRRAKSVGETAPAKARTQRGSETADAGRQGNALLEESAAAASCAGLDEHRTLNSERRTMCAFKVQSSEFDVCVRRSPVHSPARLLFRDRA